MSELLQFVQFKDLVNWSVKNYLNANILQSQFDLVALGELITPRQEKVKKQDYKNDVELVKKISFKDGIIHLREEKQTKTDLYKIYPNDLLVSKLNFHQKALALNNHQLLLSTTDYQPYIIDKLKLNFQYLVVVLRGKAFQKYLNTMNSEGVKPRAKPEFIKNLKIPLPPLETQKQLVKNYQDKINLAKQQTEQAQQKEEEIESYLYKQLGIELPKEETQNTDILQFVQFKDLQKWGYAHNIEKFKFNSCHQMVDLNSVCEINRGGSPRPISEFITNNEDGINWIKIGDTKGIEKYIFETKEKIKPEGAKRSRTVKDGDFILSNSMSFGKPYIMKTTGCIHDGWLLLRLNKKLIGEDYLYSILSSEFMFKIFQESTSGAVVQNLNIEIVKNIKIPLPPLKIQNQIAEHIQGIKNEIQTLKQQAEQNQKNALSEFEAEIFNAS